jgi:DNA polymerase-3 subunit beta
MKFTGKRLDLLRTVSFAAAVVQARNPLPALSNVKLEASKAGLSATGSDNEIWATAKCEADVSVDGCLGLPARLLKAFLESTTGESVSFEAKETRVVLRCGSAKAELPFIKGDEFPASISPEGEKVELSGGELKSKLSQVSYAASDDQARFAIAGVHFEFTGNQLNLVATNGRMLVLATLDAKGKGGYTIPSKFISALIGSLDESDVTCIFSKNTASFISDTFSLSGRLIDANFPNYRQVIPNDCKELSANREALCSLVKRAAVFTTDRSMFIKIDSNGKAIRISSGSGDQFFEDSIEARGEKYVAAFDPTYFGQAIGSAKSDVLTLDVNDELTPVKIKDKDFIAVVMPMRLS